MVVTLFADFSERGDIRVVGSAVVAHGYDVWTLSNYPTSLQSFERCGWRGYLQG